MKRHYIIFIVIILLSVNKVFSQATDEEKIKETVLNYVEGWYTADTVRMDKALHPDMVKRRCGKIPYSERNNIETLTKTMMLEYTRMGFGKKKAQPDLMLEIKVLDISDDIANVKSSTFEYVDYVQLAKVNGEWKIINILWNVKSKKM